MGYLTKAISNFLSYVSEFGLRPAIQIFLNNRRERSVMNVSIKKYKFPFFYRKGTTDFPILRIIIGQELVFKNLESPLLIIDAGANVGYASVFYANRYPKCQVIAIEMEKSNFDMLLMNSKGYSNITCLHAALWNHSNGVSFGESDSKDSYNLMDQSSKVHHVPSVTVDGLYIANQIPDIIKLDIEGAEVEVLDYMAAKNIQPKVLVVELHDHFRQGCTAALDRYLSNRTFSREKIYEYDVLKFDL